MTTEEAHSAECLLLPGNPPIARVKLARPLPCFVILVHGVNDLGEAYSAQETGICAGLNQRLHRGDLKPARYRLPPARDDASAAAQKELHTVLADPDAVYYKRSVDPASAWNSVIPFYWGSRTSDPPITKNHLRVDRFGNRVDANGAKGGGPVANATNNLVDMWGKGFEEKVMGFYSLNVAANQPTHPLLDADDRRYMVLAARRLAMLIQMIRDRNSEAVVNLVAHSQGCMLSLLAHAILDKKGKRGADCLIMNHPPYSLEDPFPDGQAHDHKHVTHARVETFAELVKLVTGSPQALPALATLLDPARNNGFAGEAKGPGYADRDNRGRVFLYFCPEDATVGLRTMQGIGWQGVPEHRKGKAVLAALGPRFHQRVWTMRARKGIVPKVGEGTRYVLLESGEDFWSYHRSHPFRATPSKGEVRILASGVPLPAPFLPNMRFGESKGHAGFLDVGPCDAATAITNKGKEKTIHTGKAEFMHLSLSRDDVDDWRPPSQPGGTHWRLPFHSNKLGPGDVQELENRLNAGKDDADHIKVLSAERIGNGKLRVSYQESDNDARIRWQTHEMDANSYHSAIVSNPEHSQHVTAWDLAIGPARICRKKSKAKSYQAWVEETRNFVRYLCTVADWRMTIEDLNEARRQKVISNFFNEDVEFWTLLDATAKYYKLGILPEGLIPRPEVLLPWSHG